MLRLADIKDGKFVPRIKTGLEEKFAEHIVALTCAAKMFSYQYGRCEMTNRDNSGIHHWQFIRQKFVDGGRVYPIVCEVDMRPANVVVKIPEVKKDSIKYISER